MASSRPESWPFEIAVREVVSLLAREEYHALERLSGGVRLSAAQLGEAVQEYGRRIVVPPEGAAPPLDVVEVQPHRAGRRSWSVDVALWTVEEGRSDLTLQLTVRDAGSDDFAIEIDDIHVP